MINKINTGKLKDILIIFCLFMITLFLLLKILPYFVPVWNIVLNALIPFILALAITYVLEPVVEFLEKKVGLKRGPAFLIVYITIMGISVLIVLAMVPEIIKQFNSMIKFVINNQDTIRRVVYKYTEHYKIDVREIIGKIREWIFIYFFNVVNSGISVIKAFFSIVFTTPIFLFLLMKDYSTIKVKIKQKIFISNKWDLLRILRKIDVVLGKYVKGKVIDCFTVGVLVYVIFLILGLKFALLFSVIIALTNLIPYIGPVIGAVPVCLFALLQSLPVFVGVLITIMLIQILESVFLMPYITSKTVDVHEITTLLALLIGGSLFGIIGALLAIPVYLVIRVIYEYYKEKSRG